ncbi:MAG TPA: glutaredoxin family protein [Telluria sp.]|jgi:glutaredoxin
MKFATSHARSATLGLALLLCMGAASAQMYKWVDAGGKTHYTDTPPPATAKTAPIKAGAGGNIAASFPYALADAVARNPVTLYTTGDCAACDSGRALLRRKGIPYTEKTVTTNADQDKLKELGGDGRLPILMVGRSKSGGFQASAWESALSLASYPERSMLPSNYQYPSPTALAPRPSNPDAEAVRVAAAAAEAEAARKKAETAAPGFQF